MLTLPSTAAGWLPLQCKHRCSNVAVRHCTVTRGTNANPEIVYAVLQDSQLPKLD